MYHFNFIGISNAIEMWICTCYDVEWDFFKKGWIFGIWYFHPPQVYYLLIPQPIISARKMTSDLWHIIKSCVRYMLLINRYYNVLNDVYCEIIGHVWKYLFVSLLNEYFELAEIKDIFKSTAFHSILIYLVFVKTSACQKY